MPRIIFKALPYDKALVTLALESGVDSLLVPKEQVEKTRALARCHVQAVEEVEFCALSGKADETSFLEKLQGKQECALAEGWEIIPVENLLARSDDVVVEAKSLERAKLASGILERGVSGIVLTPDCAKDIKEIVRLCKVSRQKEALVEATVTKIAPAGLGHRVCCDTISVLKKGQGMLVGNSAAFTFLVHAETEHNDYVAARPFRVNAGAVHSYLRMPDDRTCYLEELKAGDEVLAVDAQGNTLLTTVGRVKIEIRPMLLVEARVQTEEGEKKGAVFLQNAETIRLTAPDGEPVSVVSLKEGDRVLCRIDEAGRHFGMRIKEEIKEA